jgi:hypothetical protein
MLVLDYGHPFEPKGVNKFNAHSDKTCQRNPLNGFFHLVRKSTVCLPVDLSIAPATSACSYSIGTGAR